MLYKITKPLAKIALSVYFRKIFFSNADRIPRNKPVILAANHPTAFIEPCILACWLDEPLHFMARGDFVLKSKFFQKLYKLYHIIPIFRIQDGGYGKLKDNYSAFDSTSEILKENKTVLILAEGTTEHEKRLREIKKGVARVAFGALEKYPNLDIQIVPVGVNYTDSDRFRSVAMIDFGEAIPLSKFVSDYKENKNKGVRLLTDEIKSELQKRVIHIEQKHEEKLVNKLLRLTELKYLKTGNFSEKSNDFLALQIRLTDKINTLNPKQKENVFVGLYKLEMLCKKLKINYLGLVNEKEGRKLNPLNLTFVFPILALGYLLNFLPIWGAGKLSKFLIKDITFRASVSIIMGIVFYLLYYLTGIIIGLTFGINSGKFWLLFLMILMPIFGWISLILSEKFRMWYHAGQVHFQSKENLEKIRNAYRDLDNEIENLGSL